eukprot:765443-Hanusia_phi.AAC.1
MSLANDAAFSRSSINGVPAALGMISLLGEKGEQNIARRGYIFSSSFFPLPPRHVFLPSSSRSSKDLELEMCQWLDVVNGCGRRRRFKMSNYHIGRKERKREKGEGRSRET